VKRDGRTSLRAGDDDRLNGGQFPTPSHADRIRAGLTTFFAPGFDADAYVLLDNFRQFFFGKVALMSIYLALFAVLFIDVASAAVLEENVPTPEMGTQEQRVACGPDVRRFCKFVKPEDGPFAYLACLQEHRQKLHSACLKVLESNGQ
jgi:hypothetical protein